jgi:hypothetical protein
MNNSNEPTIITSPQTVTNAWADLGSELDMTSWKRMGIWLDVTINNSNNVRVRALAKRLANGALEYPIMIKTISATDVKLQPGYYELDSDSNQQAYFEVETNGLIPVIQWQVEAGTVGVAGATINSAFATYSNIPN